MRFLKKHGSLIIVLATAAVYFLVMGLLDITCPIKHLSGISCPGCGMTRACIALFRLDLISAFYYHPLSFTMPVFAVLILVGYFKNRRLFEIVVTILAILLITVYAIRIIFGSDFLTFDITEGKIYKLFN